MCRGAKYIFLQVVEVSKKGVSKKMHFCFVFFMLDKAKRKDEKMAKGEFQKTENTCFLGGSEEKRSFLLKWHFLEK